MKSRACLGALAILAAACNGDDETPAVRSTTSVDAGVTTTILAPPTTTTTLEPAAEQPPVTEPPEAPPEATTTTIVPGGDDDPWGPILCPSQSHPAHHKPCPKAIAETASVRRPAPVQERAAPAPARAAPSSGTGRCGGNLPPCSVMMKESGGDPTAVSPYGYCDGGDGRCHGKWQFDLDTWASLGYSGLPENHPESVQDEAAAKLLARSGCGQWSTC